MYGKMRKYPEFIGPRQVADWVFFWIKDDEDSAEDTIKDRFADWLYGEKDNETWFYKLCQWVHNKREARRETIRIDDFDSWAMYANLAPIILPMLKQLHSKKYGSPFVDDEDVPEHLRAGPPPAENQFHDLDDRFHDRWDHVVEEMIWAFEEIVKEDEYDYEPHYHILPDGSLGDYMLDEAKAHNERIRNGTTLFGKYFQNLWW